MCGKAICLMCCVVFVMFCLSSSCVLCVQCCQWLWIVYSSFSQCMLIKSNMYYPSNYLRRVWRCQSGNQNRRKTDNTMAKRKRTKGQTVIYKTLHIKLFKIVVKVTSTNIQRQKLRHRNDFKITCWITIWKLALPSWHLLNKKKIHFTERKLQ
jgi:hypothetical protein